MPPALDTPLPLSIVIIAYNEERNLPRCLRSLPLQAEIIVLDSQSTDQTAAIALSFGARVEQRAFDHFAAQKNAALQLATRPWILSIDADEELSPRLRDTIVKVVQEAKPEAVAFRLRRRLVFMGREMRFGKTQDQPIRLFRRGKAAFYGQIHEVLQVQGSIAKLKTGHLSHSSYFDLADYFQRFNRYTSAIAERHREEQTPVLFLGHLLRPWFEFLQRYVLRLGFLDGYPGYTYALISSLYAFVKYAKVLEKNRNAQP